MLKDKIIAHVVASIISVIYTTILVIVVGYCLLCFAYIDNEMNHCGHCIPDFINNSPSWLVQVCGILGLMFLISNVFLLIPALFLVFSIGLVYMEIYEWVYFRI